MPATSSSIFQTLVDLVNWHHMMWRALSTRPYVEAGVRVAAGRIVGLATGPGGAAKLTLLSPHGRAGHVDPGLTTLGFSD